MACGRLDLQVAEAAFWSGVFGKKLTPSQLVAMHPLRSLEQRPDKAVERAAFNQFFDSLTSR